MYFVRRLVARVGRGRRGVEEVVHIDGCFHARTIKVRELHGEQPEDLKASGHAAFLDQAAKTVKVRELPGEQPEDLKASGNAAFQTKPSPCSITPLCFGRFTHVLQWWMVLSLQIVANISFVNFARLSVRKHSTASPTSGKSFVVAAATSTALFLLKG